MSDTSIDHSAARAALMAWRDEASLAAMMLLQQAAVTARAELEQRLEAIAVVDAMTSADALARAIVRPAMRREAGEASAAWFTSQARALRRIDARLETVALRLTESAEQPDLPPDETPAAAGWTAPAWLRRPASALGSAVEHAASRALPEVVRQGAGQISRRVGHEVGEHSGAHERLRAAGRHELAARWLGPVPEDDAPRPYLTQLLATVDRVADAAWESIA